MRTLIELREETQSYLESRVLDCPDGIAHLVLLHPVHWQELNILLIERPPNLNSILTFLLDLSVKTVEQEGWEHETAFRELLMYYIHRHYQHYLENLHNVANDNRDDCFAHLRE